MKLSTLFVLADSRLPAGGHVHSGGVEEAVASGLVRDLDTVEAFLRRRIRTTGLVGASIAAAVCAGNLEFDAADAETDARTPSPAARAASRAQGRGLLRLAKHAWPEQDWTTLGAKPHGPVVTGAVGRCCGAGPDETAAVLVYQTMTGSATAAQRLLALDPADVTAATLRLAPLCDEIAATAARGLAAVSDPLLDVLAQRHTVRDRPLFVS
ncbi:urease accessory protein UreF [Aldersonia sp. NBC_00410]|uniref:urease accessory protein UreF n=1 Tax=Aldersonia sp. NBC_00410 TaxID=2975954 RepID=UPI002257BE67|nr:urease accessory UreF family protein [Aldersonia sp. NBC_00410]MCX5044386.1 urease accessory protein UreF [Aldersonia sp. NBC_00410]